MSRTGRCNCGSVTVTITGEPVTVRQCWCRQCQKTAAGGPTNNAMFATSDIALTGDLRSWNYRASSGNTLSQSFCAVCGTPVMGQSSARPQFATIRIGFLDEPHGLAPQIAIWTDEAPDWATIDAGLTRFPQQPPPPPGAN